MHTANENKRFQTSDDRFLLPLISAHTSDVPKQRFSRSLRETIQATAFFSCLIILLAAVSIVHAEPAWALVGEAKRLYYYQREPGKALKILNDVVTVERTNADAHYLIGAIYLDDGLADANETILALSAAHLRAAIKYAEGFSVPNDEVEAYFKLLNVYGALGNEHEHTLLIVEIETLARRRDDQRIAGRLYYDLGEYYLSMQRDTRADERFREAYENGYRQQRALVRRSEIARKTKNNMLEKRLLLLAEKYAPDGSSPENIRAARYIEERLRALENVRLPQAYATPTF